MEEYGDIPTLDVDAMMMEIYVRGYYIIHMISYIVSPIVCSMYAHSESFENYSGGIITGIYDPRSLEMKKTNEMH